MFLKLKSSGDLVDIVELSELTNPHSSEIHGQLQCGQELPEIEVFSKQSLCFPSGEELPRCWSDPDYRR